MEARARRIHRPAASQVSAYFSRDETAQKETETETLSLNLGKVVKDLVGDVLQSKVTLIMAKVIEDQQNEIAFLNAFIKKHRLVKVLRKERQKH